MDQDARMDGTARDGGRKGKRKRPADEAGAMDAARHRIESSLLDAKKARAYCPRCGALGNWTTVSVKRPIRYLQCGCCAVGTIQIVVTEQEVTAALGGAERQRR